MERVNEIIEGDALAVLKTLPNENVDCCITSPPYFGLRDYGVAGQIGLEETPEEYTEKLVEIFREVKRVLKKEGTMWLNLGDSYNTSPAGNKKPTGFQQKSQAGQVGALAQFNINGTKDRIPNRWGSGQNKVKELKSKDLIGIPWRVAFALQADGWYLRQDIIWAKPNPMPESVTDRCTKSHEYIFLLSKSSQYYFDAESIKEKAIYAITSEDHRPPGIVRDRIYGYESKEAKLRGRTVTVTHGGITIRHPKGKHGNGQQSPKTFVEKRNKRSVWTVLTRPYAGAHFATFPEKLIVPMIHAGCPPEGIVFDPFMGAGTTALVAQKLKRNFLGIELNPEYIKIAKWRLAQKVLI
jgi:DNA modification methylase